MQYLNVVKITKHELQYGQRIEAMFLVDKHEVVEKTYEKIANTWVDIDSDDVISNRDLACVIGDLQQSAIAYRICIFRDDGDDSYLWHMISNFENDTECEPHKVSYLKGEYIVPHVTDLLSVGKIDEYVLGKQELEELRDLFIYLECINNCSKNLKRLLKL